MRYLVRKLVQASSYRAIFKWLPKNQNESSYRSRQRDEPITIPSNHREKSRVRRAIGFDSHWLKNWRESFKPITKRSSHNHEITFDSHLKTALCGVVRTIRSIKSDDKKFQRNFLTHNKRPKLEEAVTWLFLAFHSSYLRKLARISKMIAIISFWSKWEVDSPL